MGLGLQDLQRALDGNETALGHLVKVLTPIIQARVVRVLVRRSQQAAGRAIRNEVEDLTQEVFLALLEQDGRTLRSWNPSLGLSLENFVGLVAERLTNTILKTGKRSPWSMDPTADEDLDTIMPPQSDMEERLVHKDTLTKVVGRLEQELSPLGRQIFELAWIEQRSPEDISRCLGISVEAVYKWRSRIVQRCKKILVEMSDPATAAPIPG